MEKHQIEATIRAMREIAHAAHKGQFRKDGVTPYVNHVEEVASKVEDHLKPIALGHDLFEDTEITIEDLRGVGFPEYILTAIDLLTHRNSEPNLKYWGKIAKNKDAATVKIADMKCNLGDNPSERQVEKYNKGLEFFKKMGYDVS